LSISSIEKYSWTYLLPDLQNVNSLIAIYLSSKSPLLRDNGVSDKIHLCEMKYYLGKQEAARAGKIGQLDAKTLQLRLKTLQNEMDIHFVLNSLNTLNHLILTDPQKAHLYNLRLAQMYKYFLISNKQRLVSLGNELELIDNYFCLLQLRYGADKLQLDINLHKEAGDQVLVPPCSLQLLIENAVKHNEFTSESPLQISITIDEKYLKIINGIRPRPSLTNSNHIGLKNLRSRFKLICNNDIAVECNKTNFTVRLPIIWSGKRNLTYK
jgi:LytS/YehU family sensor histidine kinase